MYKYILFLAFVTVTLGGCKDDDDQESRTPEKQLEIDIQKIDDYLAENNITASRHSSGIYYVIHEPGTGTTPGLNNDVTVNYEGRYLSNEQVFDSGEAVTFLLRGLIPGWQIGIPFIAEGGSITLYIPSGYAYGPSDYNGIPGNSVLIFDIDLIEVE